MYHLNETYSQLYNYVDVGFTEMEVDSVFGKTLSDQWTCDRLNVDFWNLGHFAKFSNLNTNG
jgi:hypothetical protein